MHWNIMHIYSNTLFSQDFKNFFTPFTQFI
ncbi:Uncharacterised protein [Klebsiella pneumoniae]|nr:Uncharacterised protein [Klebsiella pneumoniae]